MAGYIGKTLPIATVTTTEPGLDLLEAETKQEQRDLLELGTASQSDVTTSATDTTAGRLLKVGDFGVGKAASPPVGFDLNTDFNFSGFISPTLGGNAVNTPYNSWGGIIGYSNAANTQAGQMYLSNPSSSTTTQTRLHIRTRPANGSYTNWQEIYHTGNILGTVSATGTYPNLVPTGAIMESGSNANGEYVKYADGTMICRVSEKTLSFGQADINTRFRGTWNFPAAFIAEGHQHGSITVRELVPSGGSEYKNMGTRIPELSLRTTGCLLDSIQQGTGYPSDDTLKVSAFYIGRWK